MRRRYAASELRSANLWWIVSVRIAGVWCRYAAAPLDVESTGDQRWYRISAGVTGMELAAAAPWLGQQPERRAAGVAIVDPELDIPLLHSRGHRLDLQPAEVALWREGDDWERRVVMLSGVVVGYRYGAPGEPLELDLEESTEEDRGLIPDPGAVISDATWPQRAADLQGTCPAIIGAPGGGTIPGSQAWFVESTLEGAATDRLLIAEHPVVATSVTILDGENAESFAVEHVADGTGRLVATVDISGAAVIAVDPDVDYLVSWSQSGLASRSGTGGTIGAGSAIEAVLARSTLPLDRAALAEVRDWLDGWKIGAVVEEPTAPWEWVTQALLPLLPVAVLTGPAGWRFVRVKLDAARADCIGILRAERPTVTRDGSAEEEGRDEVANVLELRWGLSIDGGEPAGTARISGAGWDGQAHAEMGAALSYQGAGRRVRSEESVAIYRESTALRTLRWWASAYAFPYTVLRYRCWGYGWVQPGDLLWLEDDEMRLARPVWVDSVQWHGDGSQSIGVVAWVQHG